MSDWDEQEALALECVEYILEGEGKQWLDRFCEALPKKDAIEVPHPNAVHESGGDGIVWPFVQFKRTVSGAVYAALKVSFRHSRVGNLPAGVGEGSLQRMASASVKKAGLAAGRIPRVFHHQVYSDKKWGPIDFILMETVPVNAQVKPSCGLAP
jgi:hypothetical protein